MAFQLWLLLILASTSCVVCQQEESVDSTNVIEINATEVFIQRLRDIFALQSGGTKHSFYASVYGYPDLHDWIKYAYDDRVGEGYLYGMTPLAGKTRLQLSSLELSTYNTRVMDITLKAVPRPGHARRQVELELYNVDIQDMFVGNRLDSLRNVLKNNLWRTANDLYYTYLAPANRPNRMPREKEGVRVRLGSRAKFSTDLEVLQMEVQPLYEHRPCPIKFKKTTAERYFRAENFGVDWCGFRLVNAEPGKVPLAFPQSAPGRQPSEVAAAEAEGGGSGGQRPGHGAPEAGQHPAHTYVKRDEVPQRDYLWDALLTVVVPLIAMISLIILLTFIMCIDGWRMSRKDEDDLEMMQYKSVQEASNVLRTMSSNRDSATPSTRRSQTGQHVFLRSRSESPEGTQPKFAQIPRRSEERALAGQAPPPYHPSERNGKAVQGYHV